MNFKLKLFTAIIVGFLCFANANALPITAGARIGTNMETPKGYVFQFGAFGDYEIFSCLKAGIQLNGSTNGGQTMTFDPAVYAKWEFPFNLFGLFSPYAKGFIGLSSITYDGINAVAANYGAEGGVTFRLNKFFFEPNITFGYPFAWGLGINAGYTFGKK